MPLFLRLLKIIESDSWRYLVPALKNSWHYRNFTKKEHMFAFAAYLCYNMHRVK